MKRTLEDAAIVVAILFLIYLTIASAAWEIRNPTANEATVWTEFSHVLRFHKLAKFQGNP